MGVQRNNRTKYRFDYIEPCNKQERNNHLSPIHNILSDLMQFLILNYLSQQDWNALHLTCKRFSPLEPRHIQCKGDELDKFLTRYSFISHLNVIDLHGQSSSWYNYKGLESLTIASSDVHTLPDCSKLRLYFINLSPDVTFNNSTTEIRMVETIVTDKAFKNCQNVKKFDIDIVRGITDAAWDYMTSITNLSFCCRCHNLNQDLSALINLETIDYRCRCYRPKTSTVNCFKAKKPNHLITINDKPVA